MKFIELNQVVPTGDYASTETSQPVMVQAECIRSFGPRKGGKPGTLLMFANSAMFSVVESYDEVKRKITQPPSRQRGAPNSTITEQDAGTMATADTTAN